MEVRSSGGDTTWSAHSSSVSEESSPLHSVSHTHAHTHTHTQTPFWSRRMHHHMVAPPLGFPSTGSHLHVISPVPQRRATHEQFPLALTRTASFPAICTAVLLPIAGRLRSLAFRLRLATLAVLPAFTDFLFNVPVRLGIEHRQQVRLRVQSCQARCEE